MCRENKCIEALHLCQHIWFAVGVGRAHEKTAIFEAFFLLNSFLSTADAGRSYQTYSQLLCCPSLDWSFIKGHMVQQLELAKRNSILFNGYCHVFYSNLSRSTFDSLLTLRISPPITPRTHQRFIRRDPTTGTAGESSTLLPSGDIETVSNREGTPATQSRVSTAARRGPGAGNATTSGTRGAIGSSSVGIAGGSADGIGGADGVDGARRMAGRRHRGSAGLMTSPGSANSNSTCTPSSAGSMSSLLLPGAGGSGGAAGYTRSYDAMGNSNKPTALPEARALALTLHVELAEEKISDHAADGGRPAGGGSSNSARGERQGGGKEKKRGDGVGVERYAEGECNGHPNHFFPPKPRGGDRGNDDDGGEIE